MLTLAVWVIIAVLIAAIIIDRRREAVSSMSAGMWGPDEPILDPMPSHNCIDNLEYVGHIGAPGYGIGYNCGLCGEAYWSAGPREDAERYVDLEYVPELRPEDVI